MTLYLWDLAGALFPEKWDPVKSGLANYTEYLRSLGFDPATIGARDYEWANERPYQEGFYQLDIARGFQEVLSWTKHNETFSTGNREQMDWRAAQLNPKIGFDIRQYFQAFNSTFDYGNTNKKSSAMLAEYLEKKYQAGYSAVVYTDDVLKNGEQFAQAAQMVRKTHPDFSYRWYHLLNDDGGLRTKDGYWAIGNLYDFLANEKQL